MCLLKMRIVARPLNNNKPTPIVRTSQVTKLMVLGFKKPISCKEKKVIQSDNKTHLFLLDKFFYDVGVFWKSLRESNNIFLSPQAYVHTTAQK